MRRATSAPFMESDGEQRPIKRFTGWYDCNIVCSKGEAILAKYDQAAASFFHGNGLTYQRRRDQDLELGPSGLRAYQTINFPDADSATLRLFALSLLWRMCVTDLEAFSQVKISSGELSDLRRRVLTGDSGDPREFPVYFTVFDDEEELPEIGPTEVNPLGYRFTRVFLDGVVCYVSPVLESAAGHTLGGLLVRPGEPLNMLVLPSGNSAHAEHAERSAKKIVEEHGKPFRSFVRT